MATLHVALEGTAEIPGPGGGKYVKFGLALDNSGLCVAIGHGARVSLHPLPTLRKVHNKFLPNGKLTFEVAGPRGQMRQILISKALPHDLHGMLTLLDTAAKMAKARGVPTLPQEEVVSLLQKKYPEQINKQLAALRAASGSDAPQPVKGHTRLMLLIDAAGQSPAQAGKELCALATADFALTTHVRPAECNAQAYTAVGKDAAKETQLTLRVRTCLHHRWKAALFLDLDAADKVDAAKVRAAVVKRLCAGDEGRVSATQLAHGAIKEKLAMGLVVHLRSGLIGDGAEFGTRMELRWDQMDASAAPLGKCDVRFWEEGTRTAAPICLRFEMHREACKAWSMVHGDKKLSVLAASLVARLEVFCRRLAASGAGGAVRTKLLVAGWRAEVACEPFVRRGFRFEGAPDETLGFKMLKSDEAREREAAARREAAAKEAAAGEAGDKQPAAPSPAAGAPAEAPAPQDATASQDAPPSQDGAGAQSVASRAIGGPLGKRKLEGVDSPAAAGGARPSVLTPATVDAGTSARSQDDGAAAAGGPPAAEPPQPVVAEVEAEDWGEIFQAQRKPVVQTEPARPAAPVTEGMDMIDATLAALIG
jgi:hypothetical protein